MPTRSGCLYLANSMPMENMERFTNDIVPSHSRNLKRKQHASKGLRVLDMNSVNFSQLRRYQRKSNLTKKMSEKERNYVRCWKKLKGTSKKPEIEQAVVQQSNQKRPREIEHEIANDYYAARKLSRNRNQNVYDTNFIDELPEDLVLEILKKFSASANSPSDIINARLSCKKFNDLVQHPCVLARASARSLSVRAKLWSESAHQYLKMCAEAGNLEACYILGMIYFYCKANRRSGAAYMAKAAMGSHPSALYSLAIIQFNGSGGSKSDKNLRAGAALCLRAAQFGHVNAIRELGYCLQDGYGIPRHVEQGRRYLCAATNLELHAIVSRYPKLFASNAASTNGTISLGLECSIPGLDPHPANRFLIEWSASHAESREKEMRPCSHVLCGRVETRQHEFRRCSVCGKANYCSRACQAMDWKRLHRRECVPPVIEAPPVGVVAEQFVADLVAELV